MAYCNKTGIIYKEGDASKAKGFAESLGFTFTHPLGSLSVVCKVNWEQKAHAGEVSAEQLSGAMITLLRGLGELGDVWEVEGKTEYLTDLNACLARLGVPYLARTVDALCKVQREFGAKRFKDTVKFAWFSWCTENAEDMLGKGKTAGFDLQARAHLTKLCASITSNTCTGLDRKFSQQVEQMQGEGTEFIELDGKVYAQDELFLSTQNYIEDNLLRVSRRNKKVALEKVRKHIKGSSLEAGRKQKLCTLVHQATTQLPANVLGILREVAQANDEPELLGAAMAYNEIQAQEADDLSGWL